jgi:rhomboid protease GluP
LIKTKQQIFFKTGPQLRGPFLFIVPYEHLVARQRWVVLRGDEQRFYSRFHLVDFTDPYAWQNLQRSQCPRWRLTERFTSRYSTPVVTMLSETNNEPIEEMEDWVQVGHYPTLDQANDHGLVILAMGEYCRVNEATSSAGYELHAELHPADKISNELNQYHQETTFTSIAKKESKRYPAGTWLTGLWTLGLIGAFYWQDQDASLVERAASSSVGLIGRGEWWRPFTALFLHADLAHLTGNLVFGAILGTLVSRSVGPVLGWVLILASGTIGNALVSRFTYPEPFTSLGASTAVFAALGILSGVGLAETLRDRARQPWLKTCAPVLAGLIILCWLGAGSGGNTDVLGHAMGFVSGLAAGIVTALATRQRSYAAQ